MIVTLKMLQDRDACPTYVARFKRLFPTGVRVTQEMAVKYAHQFDWDWAAYELIPGDHDRNSNAFDELTHDAREAFYEVSRNADANARAYRLAERTYERECARAFARLVVNPRLRDEYASLADQRHDEEEKEARKRLQEVQQSSGYQFNVPHSWLRYGWTQ